MKIKHCKENFIINSHSDNFENEVYGNEVVGVWF